MSSSAQLVRGGHQKNIAKSFDRLCYRHSRWNVWSDFVTMAAIEISNVVDHANAEHRTQIYHGMRKKYSDEEYVEFGNMFAETVMGMEENLDQDFLGEMFMALELSNDYKGQFFTPYSVCRMMAQINSTDLQAHIDEKGWISASDPCCGAGALLVAFANECRRQNVNYHNSVLFVAQDIDMIVGCMCYIQLSLMGCPGYVVIDNTITSPSISYDGRGLIPRQNDSNVWFTPFYFTEIWHWRRVWSQMDMIFSAAAKAPEITEMLAEPETEYRVTKKGQLAFF